MTESRKSLDELLKQVRDGFQQAGQPPVGYIAHKPHLACEAGDALHEISDMLIDAVKVYGYTPGCPPKADNRQMKCIQCSLIAGSDQCTLERVGRVARLMPPG